MRAWAAGVLHLPMALAGRLMSTQRSAFKSGTLLRWRRRTA
jgi:hypothetical protein